MLHPRYLNSLHCFFHVYKEEGVTKGLYRGFGAYALTIPLTHILVPFLGVMVLQNSELYGVKRQ